MMIRYQRCEGRVRAVDSRSGIVRIDITGHDRPVSAVLPSTAFVGGLSRRPPLQGDRVIVSLSNDQAVSGRVIKEKR